VSRTVLLAGCPELLTAFRHLGDAAVIGAVGRMPFPCNRALLTAGAAQHGGYGEGGVLRKLVRRSGFTQMG
jgi:hypothetical protein